MRTTRTRAADGECGILAACAVCGCAFSFPRELRRGSDGLYRCTRFCWDAVNEYDDARQQSQGRTTERETRLPGAAKPDYMP